MRRMRKHLALALILVGYVGVALLVVWMVANSGKYPAGADTMYYVHRGNFLYHSIVEDGNWYPILDMSWYNGVETWRYWSPMPAFVLCACQALAGGNFYHGYLVFVGLLYMLYAVVWLWIGCTHRRPWMGAFLGALWFLIPNNSFMLFTKGVLARSLSMAVMPLLFISVYDWLLYKRRGSLALITGSFFFVTLCHVGWAGMTAITLLILLTLFFLWNRGRYPGPIRYVAAALLLGFLLDGFLVLPSLVGGITTKDSSQIMEIFFQPLSQTIDPFWGRESGSWNRWNNLTNQSYFGLAAFLLALFGGTMSRREFRPGFWTAVAICLMTTAGAYPLIVLLPGSQYLWMTRFISLALTVLLVCFFQWAHLKKRYQRLACFLLALECAQALVVITGDWNGIQPEERYGVVAEGSLIERGKAMTRQRMSMPEPAGTAERVFVITGFGDAPVPSSFGQGAQAAENYANIVQVNQAAEDGQFYYMFDRLLEMGNDTVLVATYPLKPIYQDGVQLDAAAAASGYTLADSNENYRLYHMDTPERFGLVSRYKAIGIGTGSSLISLGFPSVEETESPHLDDYTYEQLSQYQTVYLSNFTYRDKRTAEELVLRLSENGTRVVIIASGMPEDPTVGLPSFLGVTCSTVNFYGGYPTLDFMGEPVECDLFPSGCADWKTVYMEGLDEVWGTISDWGEVGETVRSLDFLGTVKNDNIVMVGLSLDYDYALTQDPQVEKMLAKALAMPAGELPARQIVPITLDYRDNLITITSDYDNVNTTLAWHRDIFSSDGALREVNNMTVVDSGTTTIRLRYPFLIPSLLLGGTGAALTAAFFIHVRRKEKREDSQARELPDERVEERTDGQP